MMHVRIWHKEDALIHFDAKVSDRAFDLGMPKQKLNCPEISCPPIDQRRFRASQRMRSKQSRVQSDTDEPPTALTIICAVGDSPPLRKQRSNGIPFQSPYSLQSCTRLSRFHSI